MISELKRFLMQLEPGYLPEPIFEEFARLSVTATLELVPLRKKEEIEVLVTKRPSNDPYWPNMLHTPGTVLRPTDDNSLVSALKRVFEEINRDASGYEPKKVETIFHEVTRGKELTTIFAVEITDTQESDIWIPLNEIEGQVVDTQIDFIKKAAARF